MGGSETVEGREGAQVIHALDALSFIAVLVWCAVGVVKLLAVVFPSSDEGRL